MQKNLIETGYTRLLNKVVAPKQKIRPDGITTPKAARKYRISIRTLEHWIRRRHVITIVPSPRPGISAILDEKSVIEAVLRHHERPNKGGRPSRQPAIATQ